MGNRNSKKDKSKDRTQTVVGESPPQTKKVSEKESPIEVVKQSTEKATPTPKSKKYDRFSLFSSFFSSFCLFIYSQL